LSWWGRFVDQALCDNFWLISPISRLTAEISMSWSTRYRFCDGRNTDLSSRFLHWYWIVCYKWLIILVYSRRRFVVIEPKTHSFDQRISKSIFYDQGFCFLAYRSLRMATRWICLFVSSSCLPIDTIVWGRIS
jgi:hypothetical protein